MRRKGIGIVFFIITGVAVLSGVVMFLWNYSIAEVANIGKLTYLQAMALLVLMRILVGGFPMGSRSHHGPGAWREKWKNMSEEERKKYKEKWRSRWRSKPTENQTDSN